MTQERSETPPKLQVFDTILQEEVSTEDCLFYIVATGQNSYSIYTTAPDDKETAKDKLDQLKSDPTTRAEEYWLMDETQRQQFLNNPITLKKFFPSSEKGNLFTSPTLTATEIKNFTGIDVTDILPTPFEKNDFLYLNNIIKKLPDNNPLKLAGQVISDNLPHLNIDEKKRLALAKATHQLITAICNNKYTTAIIDTFDKTMTEVRQQHENRSAIVTAELVLSGLFFLGAAITAGIFFPVMLPWVINSLHIIAPMLHKTIAVLLSVAIVYVGCIGSTDIIRGAANNGQTTCQNMRIADAMNTFKTQINALKEANEPTTPDETPPTPP